MSKAKHTPGPWETGEALDVLARSSLRWIAANLDLTTYGEVADLLAKLRGPEHPDVLRLREGSR